MSEELDKASVEHTHAFTFSYCVMFLCISLFLGSFALKVILTFYNLLTNHDRSKVLHMCMYITAKLSCKNILGSSIFLHENLIFMSVWIEVIPAVSP